MLEFIHSSEIPQYNDVTVSLSPWSWRMTLVYDFRMPTRIVYSILQAIRKIYCPKHIYHIELTLGTQFAAHHSKAL